MHELDSLLGPSPEAKADEAGVVITQLPIGDEPGVAMTLLRYLRSRASGGRCWKHQGDG